MHGDYKTIDEPLIGNAVLRMLYWPVQLAGHVLNNVAQGLKSAVQLCK